MGSDPWDRAWGKARSSCPTEFRAIHYPPRRPAGRFAAEAVMDHPLFPVAWAACPAPGALSPAQSVAGLARRPGRFFTPRGPQELSDARDPRAGRHAEQQSGVEQIVLLVVLCLHAGGERHDAVDPRPHPLVAAQQRGIVACQVLIVPESWVRRHECRRAGLEQWSPLGLVSDLSAYGAIGALEARREAAFLSGRKVWLLAGEIREGHP